MSKELTIFSPCDLEILNCSVEVLENGMKRFTVEFEPLNEIIVVPLDSVVEFTKPLNYEYILLSTDKTTKFKISIGEESHLANGFGFNMKVVMGQPVGVGDRLLSLDFEDLKRSIKSFKTKIEIETFANLKLANEDQAKYKKMEILYKGEY